MSPSKDHVAALLARSILEAISMLSNPSSTVEQSEAAPRVPSKGGRLASRLVQDWFAGLFQEKSQGGPPIQCPALRVFPSWPDAGPDHDLVIIPSQSYDEAHDPEAKGKALLSCMCRYCRYHFVFHVFPGGHEDNTAHLQHHFCEGDAQWSEVAEFDPDPSFKLYPVKGSLRYACTHCKMTVVLEITVPRLKPEWIQMITDENRIKESLRIAREEDAERYADTAETVYLTTPLSTLNQYLKNILDDDGTGPQKRISFRNKRFLVQFGRACDHIFQYLGFKEQHDEDDGESYWVPPRLTPQGGKTSLASPRAFYEDVRSEVQSVLDDKPPMNGHPVVMPISACEPLEKALGCDKAARPRSTLPVDSNEAQHFRTLGAPVDADDAMIKFAYDRQVEVDPENTPAYLGALGNLAARRAVELQMFVFTQQELLTKKQQPKATVASDASPTEKAYAHFGLSRICPEAAEYFIRVYRTYREQSPAQKASHRLALLQIARDRDSNKMLGEVYGAKMELSEACQLLGVASEWPLDSIAAMAQSQISEVDVDLLLTALDTISRSRPADDPNRAAFESIFAELRSSSRLQPSSAGASTSAGRAAEVPEGSREAVDMDLPVGLANLRNTCYLNSILQYFYSVNAVRDLALNSDLPPLEPTELNLSNLLRSSESLSKPDLETGRAFVGNEFTRELSNLFRELDASRDAYITPKQRLANAALLRPEKLRPRSSDAKSPQGSTDTAGPPLPPRAVPSTYPPVPTVPIAETEQFETGSAASSQTLIDQPEGDFLSVITKAERSVGSVPAASAEHPVDKLANGSTVDRVNEGQAKMSKLTVEELAAELDKPNVGSDQMDVDEVMGNAIDHLRAAFKVARIGRSDAMSDPIEQAFFSTFIDNRKKIGESAWNRTSRSDRWVTAYPAQSGTRDLYDALANSFDLEPLPGNLLSFTTIERPAPHFHICIQRSDGVRKNANPITIPETVYLDRFMHTVDIESSLSKARKRKWDIMSRLNEITSPTATERSGSAKTEAQGPGRPSQSSIGDVDLAEEEVDGFLVIGGVDMPVQDRSSSLTDTANSTVLSSGLEQLLTKYGIARDRTPEAAPKIKELQPKADGNASPPRSDHDEFWEKFVAEETAERERLMAERDRIFGDSHEVAYRLHAVVCHAGSTAAAGHYWVWIHDFERGVWRKYNDTTVSVHPADFVFGELNTKGEPYYLAYVRAGEVQNLVSIPRRLPRAPPPVPPRPRPSEDTVMDDADNTAVTVEHLEDVDMSHSYSA